MLTMQEIRTIIGDRLDLVKESINERFVDHSDGIIRGLLWAINGKDPGSELSNFANAPVLMAAMHVYWRYANKGIEWFETEEMFKEAQEKFPNGCTKEDLKYLGDKYLKP